VDAVLMVVEPSFESLELAGRIDSLATGTGIKKCIGNPKQGSV